MFYVQATLQEYKEDDVMMEDEGNRVPREVYVTWDNIRSSEVGFLGIDNPPEPISMEEAEALLARCAEVHNKYYDHNLRIEPA